MTKTTRLMLAVLAVCGTSAAMAQSSVNLYGRVNTSVESVKTGDDRVSRMNSNSSFIGFRGTEDLGNGLKAGFVLESQFNSDDGSAAGGMNFTRNSEINLSGNFGTVRMGAFDPYSYTVTADTISMHNHDTGITADQLYNYVALGGNKLAYVTPTVSGFTGQVQYLFGEKAEVDNREYKGGFDLGLDYANGPLGLGFGYSQIKADALPGSDDRKDSQFALRASYAIGDLTLGAYYQRQKRDEGVDTAKRNAYRLAAMYKLGASEFHANIGRADQLKLNGAKVENTAATQWTLAYNYNLSKRTKVYTFYTNVNNTVGTAEYVFNEMNPADPQRKEKQRAFGVGVRHLF